MLANLSSFPLGLCWRLVGSGPTSDSSGMTRVLLSWPRQLCCGGVWRWVSAPLLHRGCRDAGLAHQTRVWWRPLRPRGRFGLARWFSHKTCGSWLLGWGWLTLCRPRGSAGGRVCVCVCVLPSSQPRYRPPGPSRSTGSPGGAEPVPGVPAAGLQLPSAPAAAHAPALPFAPQPPPFEP